MSQLFQTMNLDRGNLKVKSRKTPLSIGQLRSITSRPNRFTIQSKRVNFMINVLQHPKQEGKTLPVSNRL